MSAERKVVVVKRMGLLAIWAVYIVNAVVYVALSVYHRVDILIPFKAFIIIGLVFMFVYSITGLLPNNNDKHVITFLVDLMLLVASALSSFLALPSIFAMQFEIQLSFDLTVSMGCIVGIAVGLFGLIAVTYYALKSD